MRMAGRCIEEGTHRARRGDNDAMVVSQPSPIILSD
jgi:hypothetical protein